MRTPVTVMTVAILASGASAGIFDESVLGDFSDDRFAPTFLDFQLGSNIVTNQVVDSGIPGVGDRDYYTFTLGAGQSIDSITLLSSTNPLGGNDSIAFIGLAFDGVFDFDPDTFAGSGLEGFVLSGADVVGNNILGDLSEGLSSLEAGSYSLWIQQTGSDLTQVSLDFNVVPTPATGTLLAIAGVVAVRRRR